MSSLHIINRGTRSNKGGGLPFYSNVEYIFSNRNNCFNSDDGLWRTPNDRPPSFQLWLPQESLVTFRYRQTYGANNFVSSGMPNWFYDNASLQAALSITGVTVDGTQWYIYETDPNAVLTPVTPDAKWVIELEVTDGVTPVTYWSEEFTVKDCC